MDVWFNNNPTSFYEVTSGSINFGEQFTLEAGGFATFDIAYGAPFGDGATIDFDVFATPVPLPAAGWLLLGGLGGLYAMRRRKS